jgi:hypothetical protein
LLGKGGKENERKEGREIRGRGRVGKFRVMGRCGRDGDNFSRGRGKRMKESEEEK